MKKQYTLFWISFAVVFGLLVLGPFFVLSYRTTLKRSSSLTLDPPCPSSNTGYQQDKGMICNLTIRPLRFQSGFLSLGFEARGGVTTSTINRGIAREVSWPRDTQMALTLTSWKCFPIPQLIQTFAKSPIIITTMSKFTVRLRIWLCPYWECVEHAQQFLCQLSFLVAASSYPEDPLLEKTFSPEKKKYSPPYFLETENILLC